MKIFEKILLYSMLIGCVSIAVNVGMFHLITLPLVSKFLVHNDEVAEKVTLLSEAVKIKDVAKVIVTAYSPTKRETDSTPFVTASMERVTEGGVAVSRDLFDRGWTFGKKVYIKGHGVFVINDLMNERFEKRLDIFMLKTRQAWRFGKKEGLMAVLFTATS